MPKGYKVLMVNLEGFDPQSIAKNFANDVGGTVTRATDVVFDIQVPEDGEISLTMKLIRVGMRKLGIPVLSIQEAIDLTRKDYGVILMASSEDGREEYAPTNGCSCDIESPITE